MRVFNAPALLLKISAWLKERFTRVTSSGTVISELDGIRMLALLCVIAHHVMATYLVQTERFGKVLLPRDWYLLAPRDWFINLNLHAAFATRVFFALSGLIVSLPFAQSYRAGKTAKPAGSFYLGRLVRIAPPYILSCLIYFLTIVFGSYAVTAYFHAFFPHLAASLFYLHGSIFGQASWINGVAWTLEVEAQFYLIAPLLAMIFRLRPASTRRSAILSLILAFSLLSEFFINPFGHLRLQLSVVNFLQFFLAGYLAADMMIDRADAHRRQSTSGDWIFLLSAGAMFVIMMRLPRLTWFLPFCLPPLYSGALDGKIMSRLLRSPVMAIPGGMCYSIFLYHPLVITALEPYVARLNVRAWPVWADFAIAFAVLLPAILVFSAVLYALAEKPFMIMARNVARERARSRDEKSALELPAAS